MAKKQQQDAAENRDAGKKLRRVNRDLQVLSAANRVLLQATDEASLLKDLCQAVVEAGGYRMAWIGYAAEDDEKSVLPKAAWGVGMEYLDRFKASWAEKAEGSGPTGAAIRAGMPIVIEHILSDARFPQWRHAALKHGHRSCISLPLSLEGTNLGALTLYGEAPDAVGSETLKLLGELAANVALGIAYARRQAEHVSVVSSLRESDARFRAAMDGNLDALSMLRSIRNVSGEVIDFEFVDVNRRAEAMIGLSRDKILGRKHSELFPSIKAEGFLDHYIRVLDTAQALEEEIRVRMPSGKVRWIRHQLVPLGDGLAVSARDVTERRQIELDLRQSLSTLGKAEELAELGTWSFDVATKTVTSSAGLLRLLGLPPRASVRSIGEIVGFFHPDEREDLKSVFAAMASENRVFRHERRVIRRDGEERVLLFHGESTRDEAGRIVNVTGFAQDVTERKQYEARIAYLATHDALTGLANRTVLNDRLSQAIAHTRRHKGELLAVLCIDLDRFDLVNDSLGHSVGDECIKAVAARLKAAMREGDTLARLGGDDFAMLLRDIRRPEDVLRVVHRVKEAFAAPFQAGARELHITCSIGASLYPGDGKDPGTLLKHADAALHAAQALGGNGLQFYTRELGERASQRVSLENALRRALDNRELELEYQPQIELASGRICGAEALIRWRHPEMGLVPPARFVPLAEETGLIIPIGEWVLKTACEQMRRWREAGYPALRMAVNVSARQFARGNIEQTVAAMKDREEFEPDRLELEVTEGMVMDDIEEVSARLARLRSLGVLVSIDDFGTGYSSLSYLRRLPVDKLKIDQSFVRDIETGEAAQRLVREIIDLAHALGFGVIAEGVETERQALFLRANGCEVCQGFYYGKPLTADAFEERLRKGPVSVFAPRESIPDIGDPGDASDAFRRARR